MKILMLNSTGKNEDGPFNLRNRVPAEALRERGHTVDIEPKDFNYDIVAFYRFYRMDVSLIMKMCRSFGAKIVYDTDDLVYKVKSDNPSRLLLNNSGSTAIPLLKEADLVTCTTQHLQRELAKVTSKPIVVVPNALNLGNWRVRAGNKKVKRIGFVGSVSHYPDFDIVLDALVQLQSRYDFEFVTMGLEVDNWLSIMEQDDPTNRFIPIAKSALEKLAKLKWTKHTWVKYDDYPNKIAEMNLDIGLAPLHYSRFNSCKSSLKFYEYSSAGTLWLA